MIKYDRLKNRFRKMLVILWISLLFNTLFLLAGHLLIVRKGGYKYLYRIILARGVSENNFHPYYLHKKSQFEVLPKSDSAIVFLGDSLTDEGEWGELFSNPNMKNRGISADTTDLVLNRLDVIVESQPKQIFLMIGINDLMNAGRNVEETLSEYKNILIELQQKTPKTQVFVQSILPVNNNISRYWQDNNIVMELNLKLRELAQEFSYYYIDVFPYLLDSQNQLSSDYTSDGLHLNGKGYLMWKQAIEQYNSLK
ncbi:MAG: GDSL-type esterase/lipase family protein [Scytonema sp. PMC 1070.18]|nr:GDSL-type esterase/lipase family protein [Scytonema sp. PMC 1070.18]